MSVSAPIRTAMSPRLNIKPPIAFLLLSSIVVSPFSVLDTNVLVESGDIYSFLAGVLGLGNGGWWFLCRCVMIKGLY